MTGTGGPSRDWPATGRAVRLAFPGEAAAVRGALGAVMAELASMGVPEAVRGTAEIVLAEVLNNVVEHAYGGHHAGEVVLEAVPELAGLAVTIRDTGAPMPGGGLPPGWRHDLSVTAQELPEGGFGWHLIRALTRDLAYARHDGHNELRFLVPF